MRAVGQRQSMNQSGHFPGVGVVSRNGSRCFDGLSTTINLTAFQYKN